MYSLVHFIIEGFAICCFLNEIKRNRSACAFSILLFSVIISVVLFVVCLSSIVIKMAAKRVSIKSVDSFDEIFNIFYSKSEGLYNNCYLYHEGNKTVVLLPVCASWKNLGRRRIFAGRGCKIL
jgi:hypothetical protein